MRCIALHCVALHCIALHCVALHGGGGGGGGGHQVRDDVFDEFRVDDLIGKKTNKAEKPKELTRLFSNVYTTQDSDSIDSKCAPAAQQPSPHWPARAAV